jgi:integrase/recombinase XerD
VSTIIGDTIRAGVPTTAHSLRDWFGTTLVNDGTQMRIVQELLRHASPQTVQLYTKVRQSKKAEEVGRLDLWRHTAVGVLTGAAG